MARCSLDSAKRGKNVLFFFERIERGKTNYRVERKEST